VNVCGALPGTNVSDPACDLLRAAIATPSAGSDHVADAAGPGRGFSTPC